jgi:sigma-B regulation protein RsbU (phosphoserine phosphatase)
MRATSLQCMEIWGGNRAADDAVAVPGIDAFVLARPHGGADGGGDIHYVSMCAAGRIARFAVADVAGHGADVSGLAVTLRDLMRRSINTADQTRITRALNRAFAARSTGGRFATALLATYFTPTDQLILCNAGHPRPLWYHADTGEWTLLRHDDPANDAAAANLPLGLIVPTDYHQFAAPLARGDLVVIYTDALMEAPDGRGGRLGEAGLLDLARSLGPGDAAAFARRLYDAVTHLGGAAPDDDATIVVLHHNAAEPPRQTITEKLRITAAMLGLVRV